MPKKQKIKNGKFNSTVNKYFEWHRTCDKNLYLSDLDGIEYMYFDNEIYPVCLYDVTINTKYKLNNQKALKFYTRMAELLFSSLPYYHPPLIIDSSQIDEDILNIHIIDKNGEIKKNLKTDKKGLEDYFRKIRKKIKNILKGDD